MNLKLVSSTVTIATAATAVTLMTGTPAQAFLIGGDVIYDPLVGLPATFTVFNEFASIEDSPSSAFSDFDNIEVSSLLLEPTSSSGFNAKYGNVFGFVSNFKFRGFDARLNLNAGDRVVHLSGNDPTHQFAATTNVEFTGMIEKLDGTDLAQVLGNFGAGETFNIGQRVSSFRMDIRPTRVLDDVEVIPTPALLPAALGFGAAVLRKRKGQKVEQETTRTEG